VITVEDYLPLSRSIAFAFSRSGCSDVDELRSIAEMALAHSARKFDPRRAKFESHAGTAVRNAILTELRRRKRAGTQIPLDDVDMDPQSVRAEAAGM